MAEFEPKPGQTTAMERISNAYNDIGETLGGINDTELVRRVDTSGGEGSWEVTGELKSTIGGDTLVVIRKPV